jgi:hypothetical protein
MTDDHKVLTILDLSQSSDCRNMRDAIKPSHLKHTLQRTGHSYFASRKPAGSSSAAPSKNTVPDPANTI